MPPHTRTAPPHKVEKFLDDHGGILYSREFFDNRSPPTDDSNPALLGSWQEKCGLTPDADRDGAEKYFIDEMGFDPSQVFTYEV